MKNYAFSTEKEAADKLAEIDAIQGYPKIGLNAKTGLPDPTTQMTERWDTVKLEDGKYIFSELDAKIVERLSTEDKSKFDILTTKDIKTDVVIL